MPLVPLTSLLRQATDKGYGVAAFNIENLETIQGVLAAVQATGAPVIIQSTPSSIQYASLAAIQAMVQAIIDDRKILTPIALHLDHGSSFELAMRAIRCGYSSVMIDGSQLNLADNTTLTRRVVDVAHAVGVSVEAELGSIGGKEDDLVIDEAGMTNPDVVADFVRDSQCDALAVAIGTAHGLYKGEPHLDLPRLARIRALTDIPLVLHGTSGVPDEVVRQCISIGVSKVNYATDLRVAFTQALRDSLLASPAKFDPKVHLKLAREAVTRTAIARILMLAGGYAF